MNSNNQSVDRLSGQSYAPDWIPAYPPALVPPTPPSPAGRWLWWGISEQRFAADTIARNGSLRTPPFVPGAFPPRIFYEWPLSRQTSEVRSEAQNTTIPVAFSQPAQYRLLADHYLPGGFFQAGSTITEGDGSIPFGWIPSFAVDPLNPNAVLSFWNAGPRIAADAEPGRDLYPLYWMYRTNQPVQPPKIYWVPSGPGLYVLLGAGAYLGPKSVI